MDREITKKLLDDNECKDYSVFPQVFPAKRRIIAIGDIHGDFSYLIHSLKIAYLIDNDHNWIGNDTFLVQVGDQIDNCRPVYNSCEYQTSTIDDNAEDTKILDFLDNLHVQAAQFGGAVISLSGNHELLNITGDVSYVSFKNFREYDNNTSIGKQKRIRDFSKDGQKGKSIICTRPPAVIIGSNIFVHAGIIPIVLDTMPVLKKILEDELVEIIDNMSRSDLISLFMQKVTNGKIDPSIAKSYIPHKLIKSMKKNTIGEKIYDYYENIKNMFKERIEIFEIGELHPLEVINMVVRKWLLKKINRKYLSSIEPLNTMFWNRILGSIPNEKHKDKDYSTCDEFVKPVLQFFNIDRMIIGHTPQFLSQSGINSACNSSLFRIDIGGSKVFNNFDSTYTKSGKCMQHRDPHVLEIIDDTIVTIL